MSKRKAHEKINYYHEKIKKLPEDRRRWSRIIYSSSEDEDDNIEQNPDCSSPAHNQITPESQIHSEVPAPENPGDVSAPESNNEFPAVDTQLEVATTSAEPVLDPDMLLALGESTDDTPEFGEKIHDNLTKLWQPLLKKGMTKETKDKLQKEYLVPDNCRLLQAPRLNVEISAAVPDMVRNRDKNLAALQQQLGSGIAAVNKAMDILIKGPEADKVEAMKHLSNSCRLLCDLHSASTQSRIKLITPSLDKTFLQVIQDAERDETVFGNKLSEKIKAAKAIEKQGLQIKKVAPKNPTSVQPRAVERRSRETGQRPLVTRRAGGGEWVLAGHRQGTTTAGRTRRRRRGRPAPTP